MQQQTAFTQAEQYINMGLSVILVRDKPQVINGREYPVKSAYPWKEAQKVRQPLGSITEQLYKKDTKGIAIVGGAVSGNLEIIDIDVKNWQGIDARLFSDINTLYPDLFSRLRIHKTPSGGYHIFYRTPSPTCGNLKLCYAENAKEAAIETRGEGGYVCASYEMGYTVHQDNPIPTITDSERESIIALCQGYNTRIKIAPPIASEKKDDYYSQNPFDHYNNSGEAETILTEYGWKVEGQNATWIWFTRPGKQSGVSASFNKVKRVYYIFTSSTEFEPSRGYNPATVLCALAHNGDKKATYRALVAKGYGKVRENREHKVVQMMARQGKEIPANFSQEAKAEYSTITTQLTEAHPYGTFWDIDDDGVHISRERIMSVSSALGFHYHQSGTVQIRGQFIYPVTEREYQDTLKGYINDQEQYEQIANAFEAFMQKNGKYTQSRLPILPDTIMKDGPEICFKFFLNGFLTITPSSIDFSEYDSIDCLIWANRVQPRNYNKGKGGKYPDFLSRALQNPDHTRTVIGYLSHEYKDETTGFIITLTETCENPKDGGGSGKNIFCKILEHTTTYTSKPGNIAKYDEKFFQSWNGQRLFCISDIPQNFPFDFLKEPSTGSLLWKRLFKDEVEVKCEDAPKFLLQTNFSYEITDGGLRRRIIPVEFTDFFTRSGGVDVHYGCHFPKGWTAEDWAGYDNYIAECVQEWMLSGRKLTPVPLTESGWMKQYHQSYGTAAGVVLALWETWMEQSWVDNDTFKTQLETYYNEQGIGHNYRPKMQKIHEAIKAYAAHIGKVVDLNETRRTGPVVTKGKLFLESAPF